MDYYMKVKDLRKALRGVPANAEVRYQRIEDVYFKKHGWKGKMFKVDEPFENEYIEVFSALLLKDENVFILNAHY